MSKKNSLKELREKLDNIDNKILNLFALRFKHVLKIAQYKLDNKKSLLDKKREVSLIKKRSLYFKKLGYDDMPFVKRIWSSIMRKSKKIQKQYIEENR